MKALAFMLIFVISVIGNSFAQQAPCDYKVEILLNNTEFESENFQWRMRATKIEGKSTNITGAAEIKDLNGKTIKSYKPWTSDSISKQKTSNEYSPNLKPGVYKITAEISVECDDTGIDSNIDTKTISIKGPKEEPLKESKPKNAESDKKIVEEGATNDKINTEEIKAPTPQKTAAKPQANEEAENTIQLTAKNNQKDKQQAAAYTLQEPQVIYESANEKARGLVMVFLLTLSILLNIILIWRR